MMRARRRAEQSNRALDRVIAQRFFPKPAQQCGRTGVSPLQRGEMRRARAHAPRAHHATARERCLRAYRITAR
eukprot:5739790-Lingulodinium_polyedra.AAC.1